MYRKGIQGRKITPVYKLNNKSLIGNMKKADSMDPTGLGTTKRRSINSRNIATQQPLATSDLSESTQKLARSALNNVAANAAAAARANAVAITTAILPNNDEAISAKPMALKSTSTQTIMSNKSNINNNSHQQSMRKSFQPGLIPLAPAPPGCHGFQPIKPKSQPSISPNVHSNQMINKDMLPKFSNSSNSIAASTLIGGNTSNGIKLTTRKNWVLPPRPKTKKICKKTPQQANITTTTTTTNTSIQINIKSKTKDSKQQQQQQQHQEKKKNNVGLKSIKSIDIDNSTGKVLINSQIHSNINLLTNDPNELKHQFENVKNENDSLKKILKKLNKEIDNLKIKSSSPSPATELLIDLSPPAIPNKGFDFNLTSDDFLNSPDTDSSSIGTGNKNVNLNDNLTNYIDPMDLSYNLYSPSQKRNKNEKIKGRLSKNSNGLLSSSTSQIVTTDSTFNLSPSAIMINPNKIIKKRRRNKVMIDSETTSTDDREIFSETPPPTMKTSTSITTNNSLSNDLTIGIDLDPMSLGMNDDLMNILEFDETKIKDELMIRDDSKNSTIGSLITPNNSGSTVGTNLIDSNLLEFDLFSNSNSNLINPNPNSNSMTNDNLKENKDDLIIY